MPVLIQILLCHAPEEVRIADCREHIMGLHAVVSVIGPKIQKFRQIPVPGIQIHCHGALAHTQLVHCHRRIVDDTDPAHHAARSSLEAPDRSALCPDLPEVKAHAAAELGYHGEIIDGTEDSLQGIGHRIDKAGG